MGETPESDRVIERVAHALDPAAWKGSSVVIGLVVFAAVLTLTVVQRALVADSTTAWILTGLHGAAVAVVVPALSWRTVREWRSRREAAGQTPSGAPE